MSIVNLSSVKSLISTKPIYRFIDNIVIRRGFMSSETVTAEVATGVMTSQVTTALALGGLVLLSIGSVVVYFNVSDDDSNIENDVFQFSGLKAKS